MKNKPAEISLFYCSNSLSADEIASFSEKKKDVKINFISLPCSGKVNLLYLLKAIETGSDGVLLVSCKMGECKYLQGNFRAKKRIESVDDLLFETGFGKGRARFLSLEANSKVETLRTAITDFAETLKLEEVQK